jgi:hypothetical protein
MRFAWLKENSENAAIVKQASTHPFAILRKIYNLAFWFFLLPLFTIIDYRRGFIIFTVIIGIRFVLNLYTNNLLALTPQQFENYPFRIPGNG